MYIMLFMFCFLFTNVLSEIRTLNVEEENSYGALMLTKYIEKGNIDMARRLSWKYSPNGPPFESYRGFITVRKEFNTNIFFRFFPAVNKNPDAPVLLWLKSYKGNSGMLAVFNENGPHMILDKFMAMSRGYHWTRTCHMIYVDNYVGEGYSFADDDRAYGTTQEEMAEDMYEFMRQFFILFDEYKKNDFYVAGEITEEQMARLWHEVPEWQLSHYKVIE